MDVHPAGEVLAADTARGLLLGIESVELRPQGLTLGFPRLDRAEERLDGRAAGHGVGQLGELGIEPCYVAREDRPHAGHSYT